MATNPSPPLLRALLLAAFARATACASPARPAAPRPTATLVAGTSGNYPPLSAWHDRHIEGFAPALLTAFARDQSAALQWIPFRWPELTSDLLAARFAIAADGIGGSNGEPRESNCSGVSCRVLAAGAHRP